MISIWTSRTRADAPRSAPLAKATDATCLVQVVEVKTNSLQPIALLDTNAMLVQMQLNEADHDQAS
jgi:hypothetical protein